MKKRDLLQLIAAGENSGVEFKRENLSSEDLAKEIVALANLQGGHILLGVEDDGAITGIQRPDLEARLVNTVLSRYVYPKILPSYEEVSIDAVRRVGVVTIGQGIHKPYVVRCGDREEVHIRVGSTSRIASRDEVTQLFPTGCLLHAELLPVPGSCLQNLSIERLAEYLLTIVGDKALPPTEEAWGERLCGLGLMAEREDGPPLCTIAGLVLFGYAPRRLLHRSGVRWMAFDGKDKSYKALDDRLVDGPLVPLRKELPGGDQVVVAQGLIENLIDAMRPFITEDSEIIDESWRRQRHWLYPLDALREAIINALCHRDWTRFEEIEVVRYADRLEVLSPGALLNTMTVEKMTAGQRSVRNEQIVHVLRNYDYVDSRGMGVRNKIIPLLKQHSGREPEFIATEDHLRIVMHCRHAPDRTED